jgi:thiol-disulfide isomerase/thioredoxin
MRLVAFALCAHGLLAQCLPDPPIAGALAALPEPGIAEARALLQQHPADFFVHREYLRLLPRLNTNWDERLAASAALRLKLDAEPQSPRWQYLYAYSLWGRQTPEMIERLERLTATHPDFPWPYLTLAQTHEYPRFQDPAKVQSNLETFRRLCPESLEPFELLRQIPVSPFLAGAAADLRRLLEARTDAAALHLYQRLWSIEFKLAPPERHAALRTQVAADMQRIQTLAPDHPALAATLLAGARSSGDQDAIRAGEARVKALRPARDLYFDAAVQWQKDHPFPVESSQREAWQRAKLDFVAGWLEKQPGIWPPWGDRFSLLAALPDSNEADLVAAGAQFSRLVAESGGFASPPALVVAEGYVRRGVRLEEAMRSLQNFLDRAAAGEKWRHTVDLIPPEQTALEERRDFYMNTAQATFALLDCALKLGRPEVAVEPLRRLEPEIAWWRNALAEFNRRQQNPEGKGRPGPLDMYYRSVEFMTPRHAAQLHIGSARIAAAANRDLDALAAYQQAIRASLPIGRGAEAYRQANILPTAHEVWRRLGGGDEGWQSWLDVAVAPGTATASPPASSDSWSARNRPLPEFQLAGPGGAKLTLAHLKGKTTLINVWATWCAPCRDELPYLAKLAAATKDLPGVQLVTFAIDENRATVEPFLRQRGYGFPAFFAKELVDRLEPYSAVPRNWLVDAAGVIRFESTGFDSAQGDAWVSAALKMLATLR